MNCSTRNPARRGSAVVEFAIVAPLLFVFIFGIIEFGRMLMVHQVITNAAREASRHGVTSGADNGSVTTRIASALTGTGITGYSVTFSPSDISQADVDESVQVTISVPYENVSWVSGFLPLQGRILSASCAMRKESGS